MNEKEQLSAIVQRMEVKLAQGHQDDWVRLLHRARTLSAFDCSAAKGEILHYFGGAGSISDLKIDEEFSDLRTQLYTLCYGKRTKH
ncbi:hypothetical protein GM658_20375 [Pseudoduganella eburnea]|uniref:DUF6966 domain-containing protein n=1 Tax=Massilia eburnea TaxID=1776165 RepID=A0A6L6QM20_9BURK|nr:hypothetical protein [Massilia eburnea]MTW12967.1 hypothetical protein [Massilia eburnea]